MYKVSKYVLMYVPFLPKDLPATKTFSLNFSEYFDGIISQENLIILKELPAVKTNKQPLNNLLQ